jgi:hypothetical protein
VGKTCADAVIVQPVGVVLVGVGGGGGGGVVLAGVVEVLEVLVVLTLVLVVCTGRGGLNGLRETEGFAVGEALLVVLETEDVLVVVVSTVVEPESVGVAVGAAAVYGGATAASDGVGAHVATCRPTVMLWSPSAPSASGAVGGTAPTNAL